MFESGNSIEEYAPPKRQALGRKPEDYETAAHGMQGMPGIGMPEQNRQQAPRVTRDAVATKHNLFVTEAGKARTYFADYQQKSVVLRAEPAKITTKLQDQKTVAAMLDLAEERGWKTINLRGTEDFKREVWVQAEARGMATQGYRPKTTDHQEVDRRKAEGPEAVNTSKAVATKKGREAAWNAASPHSASDAQMRQQQGQQQAPAQASA